MQELSRPKPSLIEELASFRQRIFELEKLEADNKEGALKEDSLSRKWELIENQYLQLSEYAPDLIMRMDLDGVIQYANRAARELADPVNLIGLPMRHLLSANQIERHEELLRKRREEGDVNVYSYEWELIHPRNGKRLIMDVQSSPVIEKGQVSGVLSTGRDMTDRKLHEEKSLMLAKNLEEANIALRVVLARRDEDQKILEEKIQSNVNEIILPFIRSLNRNKMEEQDRHYLDLLESNLKGILSPFVKNMSGKYPSLSPKEMQIAEMIRQGKNSKDIAAMLGTSVATVNTHRNNIRKKLNVRKQKTNLRSHLLSLS